MPAINFPIDETTSANAQAAATARRPQTAGGSGRLGGGEPAPGGESTHYRPPGIPDPLLLRHGGLYRYTHPRF